jgi:hypothetical protein
VHIKLDDDEAELLLDLLVRFSEGIVHRYDRADQERYIAAANRIADQLGCVEVSPFNAD